MRPLTCGEVRPLLATYVDGELDALQAAAIEQHIDSCPACRTLLHHERQLRDAVRVHAPYHRAPTGLLDRIASQTSQLGSVPTRSQAPISLKQRTLQRWLLPLAASVMLVTLVDTGLQARHAGDRLANEIADAHVRSLMVDHLADVPSTDQHTVKPWFADKLDFSPPVRDFSADGFVLSGGRLDYIDHHPAAALVYRRRLHVINLFIWPASGAPLLLPSQSARDGIHLVHWRAGGMEFWAASDLNAGELGQFAQLLQREGS